MEKTQPNADNDIANIESFDFELLKKESFDNDIVEKEKSPKEEVLSEISEYKLGILQDFLFGGPSGYFGDNRPFVNHAIKQIDRFTYIWYDERSDKGRKIIINRTLQEDGFDRPRPYKDYLNSPLWKYTASLIKFQDGYTCRLCKKRSNPAHLVVHHLSYEHVGSELAHPEDVATLCINCHLGVHGIERGKNGNY